LQSKTKDAIDIEQNVAINSVNDSIIRHQNVLNLVTVM